MSVTLYKRNNKGKPIFWNIKDIGDAISINHGIVGKDGHIESFNTTRSIKAEIESRIKAKRKEGYKALSDIYDNTPQDIHDINALISYLNTYLPKFNTTEEGFILPMLAKTLEDNKPFVNHNFSSQYKINGVRCIIGAEKNNMDLFKPIRLTYTSREGVRWNLSWMDAILLPCLNDTILDLMVEEGVCLDGELYLPGYPVNYINSFVKNNTLKQHYQLQYWCYDIAIENMSAVARYSLLQSNLSNNVEHFVNKDEHLNNKDQFLILPSYDVCSIDQARYQRDRFIELGFEGLIMRDDDAEYAFGKRNKAMFKYKKKEDGYFLITNIIPEGKRINLPKFVCKNDINDQLFECTINLSHKEQEGILINKDKYIGQYLFVEYRERSGVNELPFHAKGIKIVKK